MYVLISRKKNQTIILFFTIVFTGEKMYNIFFLMFQGGGTTVVTEETKSDVKSSS